VANVITRQHADKIARKLEATEETGSKKSGGAREHISFVVSHEGVEIAWFGVRRGSNKDQPHGHIPRDLNLSPNHCRRLADCTIDREEYIEIMRQKGLLPEEGEPLPEREEEEAPRRRRRRGGRRREG
jgi:hypothetical protein